MPECHSCPVNAAIERGEHAKTPYAELPCATCSLGSQDFDLTNRGQTHVSMDECPEHETAVEPTLYDETDEDYNDAFERLELFVAALMSLRSVTRDVVCLRWLDSKGMRHTYADIGLEHGMSAQAAESHHRRALAEFPVLSEMFAVKQARRERRNNG